MECIKLTIEEQMEYAKSKNPFVRKSISTYPSILPEVVEYLVENETAKGFIGEMYASMFRRSDSDVWTSTLAKAARKKVEIGIDDFIDNALGFIGLHLNTDVDTLKYLFEQDNRYINCSLAQNPNTPKVILDKLADNNDVEMAIMLLENPNTSEQTKEKIKAGMKEEEIIFIDSRSWYDWNNIKIVASGN